MIAIVDYGVGNVRAFANIYKSLGIPAIQAKNKEELLQANKIILPGVGAFDYALALLHQSGMSETLLTKIKEQNVPVLGICVGMQMLAARSEEGNAGGLNLIENADVKKFELNTQNPHHRIPHMGWNNAIFPTNNPLLKGIGNREQFYFLHSYYFNCDEKYAIAKTDFHHHSFTSAVNHNNVYGVQFHPEKSHSAGIQLLKNFAEL